MFHVKLPTWRPGSSHCTGQRSLTALGAHAGTTSKHLEGNTTAVRARKWTFGFNKGGQKFEKWEASDYSSREIQMSSAFFSAPPFILVAQLFMDLFNVSISDCFAVEKMSQFCHTHWFTVMFLETNLSETAWNGNISLAESDICFWR